MRRTEADGLKGEVKSQSVTNYFLEKINVM